MAKEPAGATAEVEDRLRLRQKSQGELQSGLLDGSEQNSRSGLSS